MLDPNTIQLFAVPVLTKAVDFLLEEAKNILAERRAKRQQAAVTNSNKDHEYSPWPPREALLKIEISQSLLLERKDEIESLLKQIEIHKRNLSRAQEQAALWGAALVPPIILNTIDNEEKAILSKARQVVSLLEVMSAKNLGIDIPTSEIS